MNKEHSEAAKISLVVHGGRINERNIRGQTPLDEAISNKRSKTAEFLRKHGAKTGEELKAKKCTEIYSSHFPPQVLIDDDGIVNLVNNELYYHKGKGKNRDLLFLVGEYQGMDSSGQYEEVEIL